MKTADPLKKAASKAREAASARLKAHKKDSDAKALVYGILQGDTGSLARAITLVESTREADSDVGARIVEACLKKAVPGIRIGITGVPGVGKSTFIETLGLQLIREGKKVAVLAVDPSSSLSKGSILGDKTRMQYLSRAPEAFIRPSPAGDSLGGVARKTRESITLCEAAGYDVILVETVGVGQSEVAVHGMVDFFLLLKIAGAGDELQGIKRGIMEMADAVIINKADGGNLPAAKEAQATFTRALHLYPPKENGWVPKVLLCSSTEGTGIPEIWNLIGAFSESARGDGSFEKRRTRQNLSWLKGRIEYLLTSGFYRDPRIKEAYAKMERSVMEQKMSPFRAAAELLRIYRQGPGGG
ncbi:MAG: methylmalonyl Co-A mutase-associated GTPase MeaB [Robiginitalea sp.]|jgi:LAO/AO transport system kinase